MNNDLISRSALLDDIEDTVVISARNTKSAEMRGAHKVVDRSEAAPAVDAVEVVRCKDCRKRNTVNCPMEELYVEYPWQSTKHNDFCSYGERRTDG